MPAIDFLQTLTLAISASSVALHWSRPLVESLSVLGNVIVIYFAVVLLAGSFLTESLNFSAFGLDFVPALVGETLRGDIDRAAQASGPGRHR